MQSQFVFVMAALALIVVSAAAGYHVCFRHTREKYKGLREWSNDMLNELVTLRGYKQKFEELRLRYLSETQFASKARGESVQLKKLIARLRDDIQALHENAAILGRRVGNADAFYHLVVDLVDESSIDTWRQKYLKRVACNMADGMDLPAAKHHAGKRPKPHKGKKQTIKELIGTEATMARDQLDSVRTLNDELRAKANNLRKQLGVLEDNYRPEDERWKWHENTGNCPYPKGTLIDVEYADGNRTYNVPALVFPAEDRFPNWPEDAPFRYGKYATNATHWNITPPVGAIITKHRLAALPDLPYRVESPSEVEARKREHIRRKEARHARNYH